MTTQTQTRRIVRAYYDAWTGGDMHAAGAQLADDFTGGGPFFTYGQPLRLPRLEQQVSAGCHRYRHDQ